MTAICLGLALLLAGLQFRYVAPMLVGAALAVAGNVAEILWKRSAAHADAANSAS